MKHLPFQSNYRPDFEVVEERHGNVSLYPHTEQLATLLRAMNIEFVAYLPKRIAHADHRANGFDRIVLKWAALLFCTFTNGARPDDLHLYPLMDYNLLCRVTVVQMITEHTPRGGRHHFRFYGGDDFFPEIRLSGKRVFFSDHALQRFSKRVPNNVGEDLTFFLLAFFGAPIIALTVGPGRAFVVDYSGSILAFPFKETRSEFLVTTCLTIGEISSLELEPLPEGFNQHYGEQFTEPKVRNWSPLQQMVGRHRSWERKVPLPPAKPHNPLMTWSWMSGRLRQTAESKGHGPGSRVVFMDHIPGPTFLEIGPTQREPKFDDLATLKQMKPEYDWDAYVTERQQEREKQIEAGI